jgi:CheY-like chemotaxis protein
MHIPTASDGPEAIALYIQRWSEIAVVLTDMMMPMMDGPATIALLRKINPAVKVITASGLKSSGLTSGEPGDAPFHFLPKPYTSKALLRMLAEVLDEPSQPGDTSVNSVARNGDRTPLPALCGYLN